MAEHKLDAIDLNILKLLQSDSRITNLKLAEIIGISPPPCLRRVNKLEEMGYIKGYHADIDADKMGYTITVLTFVTLKNQSEQDIKRFSSQVEKWSFVRECFMLAGDSDFMLRIVAKDWQQYNEFLVKELTAYDNVEKVKSSLCVGKTKNEPGIPL